MKKAGIIALVAVGLVLGVAAFAFAFGTPQTPVAPQAGVPTAQAPSASASAPATSDPAGEKAPFAVQIPGCKCHSDDPVVVEEHSRYRMNECRSCHKGDTPMTGAP